MPWRRGASAGSRISRCYGLGGLASYQPTYHSPAQPDPDHGRRARRRLCCSRRSSWRRSRPRGTTCDFDWRASQPAADSIGELFESLDLNMLIFDLLFINIFWGLVNLLPVYPLDGGQIAREVLGLVNPADGLRQSLWLSVDHARRSWRSWRWTKLHDQYIAHLLRVSGLHELHDAASLLWAGRRTGRVAMKLTAPGRRPGRRSAEPRRARVVLLGASNLTKGIGTVLETAYRSLGTAAGGAYGAGPWPLLWACQQRAWAGNCRASWNAACGTRLAGPARDAHGRPGDRYRQRSALRRAGRTDRRLGRAMPRSPGGLDARTVVTLLPVENLLTLSRGPLSIDADPVFSRIAGSRWTKSAVRAHALNERSAAAGRRRGLLSWWRSAPLGTASIRFISSCGSGRWPGARFWPPGPTRRAMPQPARGSLARTLYLQSRVPERRRVLGFEQRGQQPAGAVERRHHGGDLLIAVVCDRRDAFDAAVRSRASSTRVASRCDRDRAIVRST